MENNTGRALESIRGLIEYDRSQMREHDGYIGDSGKLLRLSDQKAEVALRYGIPIGMCSLHDDYHGSHKGEYNYTLVNSMEDIKRCRGLRMYEDRPSIYPYLPDPRKMLEYIEQIAELESAKTPAQAALHEPDIYDDEATAALRQQLIQRLDENLLSYFDDLLGNTRNHIPDMSPEIAAITGAHYYLAEIHNFHKSELEYLLQFRDPLAVVADKFEAAGMDDYSDIMWDIFDRQDALQGGYERMPDAGSTEALKQALFRRLDSNLSEYCEGLMDVDKRELIGMAGEIAAQYAVRDYLKDGYDFREGDAEYLLGFKHPLALVANQWPGTLDGFVDMSGVVQDILDDRDAHGSYLKADAPVAVPAEKEQLGKKTSVIEQIRQARENPQPHKDATGKGREPEL